MPALDVALQENLWMRLKKNIKGTNPEARLSD